MLTVSAQSAASHPRQRPSLTFFVADNLGERIFEASGAMTLEAMQETGGLATAAELCQIEAFARCVEFCGSHPYWVSPQAVEAVNAQRSADLESMWRS